MRLWSDKIEYEHQLYAALHDAGLWTDCRLHVVKHTTPARHRTHRFDVILSGEAERHTRFRNWGTTTNREYPLETRAATWMDWGWFLAILFRYDPDMLTPYYAGRDDFVACTTREYQRRLASKDRSALDWQTSRYGLDDDPCPFVELGHLPPKRLLDLNDPAQVEPWLASA